MQATRLEKTGFAPVSYDPGMLSDAHCPVQMQGMTASPETLFAEIRRHV